MSEYEIDFVVDFVKERPILFKAEMVRAILEGRKTQTRRMLKVQPLDVLPMNIPDAWVTLETRDPEPHGRHIKCRFGKVGDRLWVRETWYHANPIEETPGYVSYRADGEFIEFYKKQGCKWKPSIFMPRWASRITLEIVSVRIERLQDITENDAVAEGVMGDETEYDQATPKMCYAALWEKINGPGSWDANPFVWVVEFKRVDPRPGAEPEQPQEGGLLT